MNNHTNNCRNFLSKMLMAGLGGVTLFTGITYAENNTETIFEMTEEQKGMLFFIYQEEKVARDVYITLGNIYTDENTFASIQLSEQRHIDSARDLCEKYNVNIDVIDEESVGDFVSPVLQELYDTCVVRGEKSLLEALKVGELIEFTDMEDLEDASVGMPADVVHVFENLKEGSLSHLDAFEVAIAREA